MMPAFLVGLEGIVTVMENTSKSLYEQLQDRYNADPPQTNSLQYRLIFGQYDDALAVDVLTDIARQAGWSVVAPKSDVKIHQVIFAGVPADNALDNICRLIGWFWRYAGPDTDCLIFANIEHTIRERMKHAEESLRAACDDFDTIGALTDPVECDTWYSVRYATEAALGRLIYAKKNTSGTDLIARLYRDWTGKVPQ
jgi:hypothetical protein